MKKNIILLLIAGFCCSHAEAQLLLRYNLEKGKNYATVFEVAQTINQTVMGAEQNVDSKQTMEMDMQVEEVQNDITDMKISYTRIAVAQITPMGEMQYDSDNADAEVSPAAIGYAALVDNGFSISFNGKGKIQKVTGLDAMVDRMIDRMDLEDSVQSAETKKIMKEQFDEEALVSQMQNSLAIFPEREVEIGDTWTVDHSVTAPFPMEVISTYMLTDYDDDFAYLSVDSKIRTGENSSMENAGMTMDVEISGEQSGTVKIDRVSGMILESSLAQKVAGTINMTSPQEMSWPIELETEVMVTGRF